MTAVSSPNGQRVLPTLHQLNSKISPQFTVYMSKSKGSGELKMHSENPRLNLYIRIIQLSSGDKQRKSVREIIK